MAHIAPGCIDAPLRRVQLEPPTLDALDGALRRSLSELMTPVSASG